MRQRRALVVLLLAGFWLGATAPVLAQDPSRPSPRELWEKYPLRPDASPSPAPRERTEETGRAPAASRSRPAAAPASDDVMTVVLTVAAVCLVLIVGTLLLREWRRRRAIPVNVLPLAAIQRMGTVGPPPARSHRSETERLGDRAEGGKPEATSAGTAPIPPDPTRGWTAEIEWRETGPQPVFCAVTRDPTGGEVELACSPPVEWPPAGPDAVRALSDAVQQLGSSLVDAGWKTLPAGTTWYAKRFQWKPRPAGVTARRAGRFARTGLPETGQERWRSEIELNANASGARVQVAVLAPDGRRSVIAESRVLAIPDERGPDEHDRSYRGEVQRLAAALRDAGWEPLSRGAAWYELRFTWPREGSPPDRLPVDETEAESPK